MPRPDILFMNSQRLQELDRTDVGRELRHEEITHIFREQGALWQHSGNPKDPHVQLTSGKCSNGFVDTARVLRHTNLCMIFADQLRKKLSEKGHKRNRFTTRDIVVGSDHAAATISFALASLLKMQHEFCEKRGEGPNESQLFRRLRLETQQMVLQVEDLVTTAKTLKLVREGIREGNPDTHVVFFPFVATVVNRSTQTTFEGDPIVSLVHYDMQEWEPGDCPLCKAGSEAIRPKGAENWKRLNLAAA